MTLTVTDVRKLVQTYRSSWSPDELERVLVEERDGVAEVLGVRASELPSDAATFAARFDTLEKKRKGTAREDARTVADRLARELASHSVVHHDGTVDLYATKLTGLACATGYDELVFVAPSFVGVLPRAYLASVMRELRGVTVERARLDAVRVLEVTYKTRGSRDGFGSCSGRRRIAMRGCTCSSTVRRRSPRPRRRVATMYRAPPADRERRRCPFHAFRRALELHRSTATAVPGPRPPLRLSPHAGLLGKDES